MRKRKLQTSIKNHMEKKKKKKWDLTTLIKTIRYTILGQLQHIADDSTKQMKHTSLLTLTHFSRYTLQNLLFPINIPSNPTVSRVKEIITFWYFNWCQRRFTLKSIIKAVCGGGTEGTHTGTGVCTASHNDGFMWALSARVDALTSVFTLQISLIVLPI